MDPITQQTVLAAAGAAGGDPVYVDDVFSTFLFEGTGAAKTITNGIDLAGEGGLVWIKARTAGSNERNMLLDTERGIHNFISTNQTTGQSGSTNSITAFNSNGFTVDDNGATGNSSLDYVSWTFRKAPGFFDIVSYSGCYAASNNNYNIDSGVSFDGTGDSLTVADTNGEFSFGNGDFTIEGFIYPTGVNSTTYAGVFTTGISMQLYFMSTNSLSIYLSSNGSGYDIVGDANATGTDSIFQNEWSHIALTRSGNDFKLFINGVSSWTLTSSATIFDDAPAFGIGDYTPSPGSYGFQGYISNFRVVKGTALYTSNFTVPTAPLTNVTNTKLLCCQSNTSASAAAVGESFVSRIPSGFTYWTAGYTSGWSSAGSKTSSTTVSDYVSSALPASGKHYWETTVNNPNVYRVIGVTDDGGNAPGNAGYQDKMSGFYYNGNPPLFLAKKSGVGAKTSNPDIHGSGTGNNWVDGDIIQWAFDADNSKMWVGQNGTWYSGDPGAGTGETFINMPASPYFKLAYVVDSYTSLGAASNTTFEIMSAAAAGETYPKVNGNATAVNLPNNNVLSHSLGSVPGMIVVKNLTTGTNWETYHRSTGATKKLELNETSAAATNSGTWIDTEPTASVFTVGSNNQAAQDNYIAYIFAHDDAQFGTNEDESIIKCGSYTGTTSGVDLDLGFEPQWVMIKRASNSATNYTNWAIFDNMRGVVSGGTDTPLAANLSTAENGTYLYGTANPANLIEFSPTGIRVDPGGSQFTTVCTDGENYIYMAIRRPHKPPVYGTDVFSVIAETAAGATRTTGFPIDLQIGTDTSRIAIGGAYFNDRLRGVSTNSTPSSTNLYVVAPGAETTTAFTLGFDNTGFKDAPFYAGYPMCWWNFRRAPGFMDMVVYEGSGTNISGTEQVVNHNLGVTPELVIVKNRDTANKAFFVWSSHTTENTRLQLDETHQSFSGGGQYWQVNSTFTDTQFGLGYGVNTNKDGDSHIAYLFASRSGISKIDTYPGTGSDINVNCGFTGGARFILIKRIDAEVTGTNSSGWYVWDKTRGIQSGNDPYIRLDTNDAEVTDTDYIDPLSSGFTVTSSAPDALNVNGGTYLFLAIA